ncbi:acid phosphatase-domain-containing protein [Xylaria sp. FL1042]|nr:acid phosphatase-domain-containing protein [Xylaria sp. FL1042]
MSPSFPMLVAFDLDGTVWNGWLNEYSHQLGKGGWVTDDQHKEDNLEMHVDSVTIRDKLNPHGFRIRVAKDFPKIAHDILKHGGCIAIASRNTNKNMTNRALSFIQVQDPRDKWPRSFTKYIKYNEVFDRSKLEHFGLFHSWLQKGYNQMLLFDDQNANKEVELWKGVTFQKIDNPSVGITWNDYCRGIDQWRRYDTLRLPVPPDDAKFSSNYKPYFIGWVGTDVPNAQQYQRGLRRLPTDRSARWGYGLYVTDNPNISLFFAANKREQEPTENLRIVALYARDKKAFINMNKCWIPEKGKFHQVDNEHLSFGEACDRNDALDYKVWQEFGYHKPYLLFTRHHYMDGMHFLKNLERFNELVIYPQAQDAMFFGKVFTVEEANALLKSGEWQHRCFHHRIKAWNIKMHRDAKQELLNTEKKKSSGEVVKWKLVEDTHDFY